MKSSAIARTPEPLPVARREPGQHRLLIVDDSTIIRNRIAKLCQSHLLPPIDIVGLAADGEEAIRIAREKHPTLITMDLTMPAMEGDVAIGHLVDLLPDVRILVVSALADRETALRAIRKGAHGFLHKPFGELDLIMSLTVMME